MAIPEGYEAQVRPRSGLGSRGITLPNSPGTIDSDYRGEVRVPLINLGAAVFTIEPGMRIAQMVIAPVAHADIVEVESLDNTDAEPAASAAPAREGRIRATRRMDGSLATIVTHDSNTSMRRGRRRPNGPPSRPRIQPA